MERDQILVVGGYGQVGSIICRQLARIYPGKICIAGRDIEKAQHLINESNGSIQAISLDIHKPFDVSILQNVKQVIVCVEQQHTQFVEACFQQGIDYIDISASHMFLQKIEQLTGMAQEHNASATLSIGLAPGVTNLLAKHVQQKLGCAEELSIYIMLGLGDSHGKAAINWTVNETLRNFYRLEGNERVPVKSFIEGSKIYFGKKLGWHTAYDFNFADQHVLQQTLSIPVVKTQLCFDSNLITSAVHLLKKTKLIYCMPVQLLTLLFSRIHIGQPKFAVKVIGRDRDGKIEEIQVSGKKEASATAIMACFISQSMYESKYPTGVHHIEQLFSWEEIHPFLASEISIS
ncbi:saccharopine dehydrogenase NADP-binding domain-containing protein [Metasolibacillus meyeri]|uniref:Saccharopine dehydrogenase NADP-binding domain-containing protein n=1 Tax=Metasolibacillus meyeri TaxID=1071052 RepID=A0AAW9NR22_9BACL|nr:saccharopine dehydrogenase NADP-binding domain-containing protein [Metasolibacillus meyeri]MEC1178415.1 saccharopine dehydrogenase NADP-binding domain-containing protein [Metasolibacillus meyeri]